jgi:hypothetical protein
MDITTIIMILFVIIGGYLLTTNQVEGTTALVLTIFVVIITVIIIINLPIFNSYYEFVSSPVSASKPMIISGKKYKATSTSYSVSTWIYVSDWNVGYGNKKTIMERVISGQANPGLYLGSNVNNLIVNFSTFDKTRTAGNPQTITVENVSIQKWVNITVSFGDRTVDTYVNGKLVHTFVTDNPQYVIPETSETSNKDFSITPNDGFSGRIANTRYYDRFLTPKEAWDIYKTGFNNNFLNQFNAKFIFYQNENEKASFYLL